MGVTWPRLGRVVYKWHAGEAWLAPLTIQAPINANTGYSAVAEAEAVLADATAALV